MKKHSTSDERRCRLVAIKIIIPYFQSYVKIIAQHFYVQSRRNDFKEVLNYFLARLRCILSLNLYCFYSEEAEMHVLRLSTISSSDFEMISTVLLMLNGNHYSDSKNRTRKRHQVVERPSSRIATMINRYTGTPEFFTRFIIHRLASLSRWRDMDMMFGRYSIKQSELWNFVQIRKHLLIAKIGS